ncbi:MAG: acylphosphatase [Hyphomicrobiaceae bacterium]|nr:acylphosphatase [Hyphomicrobiaceae bacterium]
MAPPATKAVHVRIEGQVQGVGYRAWTASCARDAGLDGYVLNRRDGSVEAVFQGPAAAVDAMIAACWTGPSYAAVTAVEIVGEGVGAFTGFTIRPSV